MCQIVSIVLDSEREACQFYWDLRERNILTSVFVYPATPPDQGLVRFSVHSELTRDEIDYVVDTVYELLRGTPYVRHEAPRLELVN